MHLVQFLLPLRDNDGRPFPSAEFDRVNRELTDRFGGVTAYLRSPARGAWREDGGDVTHDDVTIIEVMDDDLDRAWWQSYRHELEARFRQDEIIVRATQTERL
ncbi:MAG: hypothetical protein AVDCRST_MAG68-5338 [uncultured Gemmatimonadetes bacterium]|uniref:DUF1330 domain-containing protein n=1 Tax=uncultured Gemmatimonadota bacterium TaxID=203437 RepID=A0A6J4MXG3_9BACT|nr:MAG: hypothetical protein AVDCRST_MAG68-5338 [uncultured Gemmatimonadota bacterium]